MTKKSKIIISGLLGFVFFPIWLYTLYLIFFDKSKDAGKFDPKSYAFPAGFTPTYSHFFGDSAIAVDCVSDQIHLARGATARTYPFSKVRTWESVLNEGGQVVGQGLAVVAHNLGAANRNARSSGLFVTVKDVDYPRWQVMFPHNQIEHQLARWAEILRQSVNKDAA